jgi:hypothetical protein
MFTCAITGYTMTNNEFYVFLNVLLSSVLVNNQTDAQFFFSYMFISILYIQTLLTYLLTPWSRVLLEKLTSKLCS